MRTYKIILANAKVRNGNRGCVALSITAMYLLRRLIKDAGSEVEFYLPDSADSTMGRHQVEVLDETIDYIACGYPIPLSYKGYLGRALHFKTTIDDSRIYKSADFIFDIGQGDSFTDIYGRDRFNVIDRIHRAARLFGKPYCLLPQTIGPFHDEKMRKTACESIRKATYVMARDKQSLQFVYDHVGKDVPTTEVIDVAFFMPYNKKSFPKENIHVGINISALLWHGGYNKNNQFGLKADYPILMTHVIDYFLSQTDVTVHLVAHVVDKEKSLENDYAVCYELWERYASERVVLAPFFFSPVDAKGYISGLDFFLGARMHTTIAAYSTGVPVLPMAYSRKFGGLFADTLGYDHVTDLTAMDEDEVMQLLDDCFTHRQALKTEIDKSLATKVQDYYNTLNAKLSELLKL